MQPQSFTLANGLRVILINTKAFPTLTTILLFGAGSRYENEKNNGIAHFFEHIPFKGTKKYPSAFAISSLLEGMGAVNNAFTSKDHTGYWVKGMVKHFAMMLDILADMVRHPLLEPAEIEKEKGVIVEEINMYEDSPARKVGDLFENLLYPGHPLGFDTTGTKETVTRFTRQTFFDFMDQLYSPRNAVLVVAGGLNQIKSEKLKRKSYLQIIEEKLGQWKSKVKNFSFAKVVEKQDKPNILVKHKKTEQTHFSLGFRTFSLFDRKKYALSVLSVILGGGMSSKLFIEVRERRGLCYYISTHRESHLDVGYMTTQAGVTNDKEKIKESIKVILAEHKKIAAGEVNDEEIKRAKEMIRGRIMLSMEDSSAVATWYGTKMILENKVVTVEEVLKTIMNVKKDELIEIAREFFRPEKLNLALIGPHDEVDFKLMI